MRQVESIRFAVGGQVLVLEGLGRRLAGGVPGDTVFQALGIIDWMPDRGYRMRSWILNGLQGEFPIAATDSGFSWRTSVPGGQMEYVMTLTPAGEWRERGTFIGASGGSFLVVDMLLKRTGTLPPN